MAEDANHTAAAQHHADTHRLAARKQLPTGRREEELELTHTLPPPCMESRRLTRGDLQELFGLHTSDTHCKALCNSTRSASLITGAASFLPWPTLPVHPRMQSGGAGPGCSPGGMTSSSAHPWMPSGAQARGHDDSHADSRVSPRRDVPRRRALQGLVGPRRPSGDTMVA